MVQIKLIRRQRNCYGLFLILSAFMAGWLGIAAKTEAAITFGTVSVVSLIFAYYKKSFAL